MPDRHDGASTRLILLTLATSLLLALGCDRGGGSGACQSTPRPSTGTIFCQDNFDASECRDFDRQQVNSVSWFFHSGQTCDERR